MIEIVGGLAGKAFGGEWKHGSLACQVSGIGANWNRI